MCTRRSIQTLSTEKNHESHSKFILDLNIQRYTSVFSVRGQKAHIKDGWMDLKLIKTKSVSRGNLLRRFSTNSNNFKCSFPRQDFKSVYNYACLGHHLKLIQCQWEVWYQSRNRWKIKKEIIKRLQRLYGNTFLIVTQWSSKASTFNVAICFNRQRSESSHRNRLMVSEPIKTKWLPWLEYSRWFL